MSSMPCTILCHACSSYKTAGIPNKVYCTLPGDLGQLLSGLSYPYNCCLLFTPGSCPTNEGKQVLIHCTKARVILAKVGYLSWKQNKMSMYLVFWGHFVDRHEDGWWQTRGHFGDKHSSVLPFVKGVYTMTSILSCKGWNACFLIAIGLTKLQCRSWYANRYEYSYCYVYQQWLSILQSFL